MPLSLIWISKNSSTHFQSSRGTDGTLTMPSSRISAGAPRCSLLPFVLVVVLRTWVDDLGLASGTTAPTRVPANPASVLFYNLRPRNLSTDIIEKDSADALGDIFFYITDRLTVPYD